MEKGITNTQNPKVLGYTKEELEEFKTLLTRMLQKAKMSFESLTEVSVNENSTDDTYRSFEPIENARDTLSQSENSSLAIRQDRSIKKIEEALARIRFGDYGVDRNTGELIPKERLRAAPFATLNVQSKIEENLIAAQKIKKDHRSVLD